ncbi:zinc finger protein 888-like isoform X1 [Maniola jurtina]|uniref:zinc finger protein 888-like isoform X1 n=1 Tax=Maniola jurtina TaxID=191418 RepID=UPI001E68663A|nr:zinc finger protein 888-like isoform X1 [Maniola jurtina]
MNFVKSEMDNVCRGCLCVDRILIPLNKNVDLFFIFLGNELSISEDSKYFNVLLCWECVALLKKAAVFRKRVQTAQRYFERLLTTPIPALTTLKIHKKDDYDQILVQNEDFEPKVKPESLSFEVAVQIEEDPATDCHIKEEGYEDDDDRFLFEPDVESKPDIPILVKKEKKKKKNKYSPLGRRVKTKSVKYTDEERDKYIEHVDYTMKEVLSMERDTKKPFRIKNMDHRCNVHIRKLYEAKRRDLSKKVKDGGIKCSECDTTVADREAMAEHWAAHPVALLRCHFCGILSKSRNNMNYHIDARHSIIYSCTLCNVDFRALPEYHRHDRSLHKTLFCDYCGKKFQQKSGIERHIRRYHLPIQCEICKMVYKRESTLDNHMARCHPEVKWKPVKRELTYCVECDLHFPTEDLFKRHLRVYVRHQIKPPIKLQNHHLPAICYICKFEFKRKSYLSEHMLLMHQIKKERKKPIVEELAYCVECNLQFPSEYFYKRHLRSAVAHHRRKREKVPCPDCGKIFSRKSYMDNHYKLVHVRKSQHYCEVCDKHFINGYAIRTHKKFVHEKYEKPKNKICDICGRGFHTNRVLINHKRTHTGERPHKCSYCPAAFAQNVARKTHEKTQHKHLLHELKGFP